jgi:hypothetical protein
VAAQAKTYVVHFIIHGLFHHAVTSLDSPAVWLELISCSRSRAAIMASLHAVVHAVDGRPAITCAAGFKIRV